MKRRWFIGGIGVVLLAGGLVLVAVTPRESSYKGRTLTSYLEGPWDQVDPPEKDNPHFAPNEKAIRAIGTNGIPTLLRLCQAKDPAWKTMVISLVNRQTVVGVRVRDAEAKRRLAQTGFYVLGADAAPAVPDLIRITQDPDAMIRFHALMCLSVVAPKLGADRREVIVPVLNRIMRTDPDPSVKAAAESALNWYYPDQAIR